MKDEDIVSIGAHLKQLQQKHAQALQEKDIRIKETEEQLKQLREKHAQVLREKDTRIKRTEEQLKQCKTWLQVIFENAPPFLKMRDKERDGE